MFGLHWLGYLFVLVIGGSCWIGNCAALVIVIMLLCCFGFGLVVCFGCLSVWEVCFFVNSVV